MSIAMPLDVLARTPSTLRAMLAGLPPAITSAAVDKSWSPRDVVAHLASLDSLTLVGRVRAIIEEPQPQLAAIDEHDVLERSGLRGRPLVEVLDEFKLVRTEAVLWLNGLSPEQLNHTGQHAEVGALSAAAIIHHKAWHDLLHVQQICRMLSVPLDAGSGGMRRYH